MNSIFIAVFFVLLLVAVWFAWRYFSLKQRLNNYADVLRNRPENFPADIKGLEGLSSAVVLLNSNFAIQLSTLDTQNARLATVLEQLTDGVLIADSNGQVQFANPAAQKLFDTNQPIGRSVAEVVR